jgi:mono/diheme cytochrome c family protein
VRRFDSAERPTVRAVYAAAGSVAAATLFAVVIVLHAGPQDNASEAGRRTYLDSCAVCHGTAGTGYGPASWALRRQPPDLTRYSDRTIPFPRERIRNTLNGHIRMVPSQGRNDMPVFRGDLDALLDYLEQIQARPFGSPMISHADLAAAGGPMYRTHCTACHGADGRGPAPSGYAVGLSPPDLTTVAARHRSFDIAQLKELIARCRDSANAEMPSWRHAFRAAGWSDAVARANIEALAHYLESIQRP